MCTQQCEVSEIVMKANLLSPVVYTMTGFAPNQGIAMRIVVKMTGKTVGLQRVFERSFMARLALKFRVRSSQGKTRLQAMIELRLP